MRVRLAFKTGKTRVNLTAATRLLAVRISEAGTCPVDKLSLSMYSLAQRRCPMQGYCVKCKAKREIKNAKAITMKNGKPATQGVCPVCGTKMFRIGKA